MSLKKKDKKGRKEEWDWEQNEETRKAVERLHETIRELEKQCPDYGVGK